MNITSKAYSHILNAHHLKINNRILQFSKHKQSSINGVFINNGQISLTFPKVSALYEEFIKLRGDKILREKERANDLRAPNFEEEIQAEPKIQAITETLTPAKQLKTGNTREMHFSQLTALDITYFKNVIGDMNVILEEEEIRPYNTDFTKKYKGNCQVVLTPTSTEEVSAVLKYCNEKRLAVVPQGGNTGLVGGSVPLYDEIVLSLRKLSQIIDFDPAQGVMVCQAGCILEDLQDHAKKFGYLMPLDLGAKGSCMIGGNLSTNAGGIKYIKYGSMHANTLGLKVVLADGTILDNNKTYRKDAAGYNLNHLFIGAEGTLGIITEAAILCHPQPKQRKVCLIGTNNFEHVLKSLQTAKRELSDSLSAIEYMDYESVAFSLNYFKMENPFRNTNYKHYLLIEVSSNQCEEQITDQTLALLEEMQDSYEDGIICETEAQTEKIWKIREGISMATADNGFTIKFDVSLNSQYFYDLVEKTQNEIGSDAVMIGHGHIGDGNLHLNCTIKGFENRQLLKSLQSKLEPYVFNYIKEKKGSISAEHGVGQQKPDYLEYSKTKEMIQYMGHIKNVFDPKGILNPYKVLPSTNQSNSRLQ